MKVVVENRIQPGHREIPKEIIAGGESSLRCLHMIIEDASADFYLRRMAVWWGAQSLDAAFNNPLNLRFIAGKDRVKLFQKAESSREATSPGLKKDCTSLLWMF